MIDTFSWAQVGLVLASSMVITLLVFLGLVWWDYRRDRR